MANVLYNTKSFDDLEETTELNEDASVIVFRNGEALTTTLKVLKRRVNPSPTLIVTAPTGSTITITKDELSYSAVGGTVSFDVPEYGDWVVKAELDGSTVSKTQYIDTVKIYELTLNY